MDDMDGEDNTTVSCKVECIATFSVLLGLTYIFIFSLFIIVCCIYCRRKQTIRYQPLRKAVKGDSQLQCFPNASKEADADNTIANEDNPCQSNTGNSGLVGIDVSMDNPNYMSNSTIRIHQENEPKRFSVISQSHQRSENPVNRASRLEPRVNYTVLEHPIVVVEESRDEDVYSLVNENESEHNYSCISSNDISRQSQDGGEDEESEHDYSCISNTSRVLSSTSLSPLNHEGAGKLEPVDYEEFYSIANAEGDDMSESEGEERNKNTECGHKEEGSKESDDIDIDNKESQPDSHDADHNKDTSVETNTATKTKRRSATSTDVFRVQSPNSQIAMNASDSRLTRLQGIEGRSTSSAAAVGPTAKPVPKPRVLRKALENNTKQSD